MLLLTLAALALLLACLCCGNSGQRKNSSLPPSEMFLGDSLVTHVNIYFKSVVGQSNWSNSFIVYHAVLT